MLDKMSNIPFRYRPFNRKSLGRIRPLSPGMRGTLETLGRVFPFKVNPYIVDELIDWERAPDDPVFRLYFPTPAMLPSEAFERLHRMVHGDAGEREIQEAARTVQMGLNPHPGGQMHLNVPVEDGRLLQGIQHKYGETVLFFPRQGQTCMAYCAYCFRWAQFIGMESLRFACDDPDRLVRYLGRHTGVTDVLFTGGDPLTMGARVLARYIEPLLRSRPGALRSIRIGSKVPAQWPYRFTSDKDADDLLRLFERVVASGLHLAVMAHYTHPRELETPAARSALRRILATGATVRCQAPLVRGVNDAPGVWRRLWENQVSLGAVPYYMFVQRNTGPKAYFEVPLAEAYRIFTRAYRSVSGLARTVRGPSMSATPGKVLIDGVIGGDDGKRFVLRFIQARNPSWVNRPFLARYDEKATWFDQLAPVGDSQFFFQDPREDPHPGEAGPLRNPGTYPPV